MIIKDFHLRLILNKAFPKALRTENVCALNDSDGFCCTRADDGHVVHAAHSNNEVLAVFTEVVENESVS